MKPFLLRPRLARRARSLLLAALLVSTAGTAPVRAAEPAPPAAATLLFDTPQLARAVPGQPLHYGYHRKMSDAELGPSFDDDITLQIEAPGADAPAEARTVKVDFFGRERHRAAGPFEAVTGNPVLVLFLENHVAELSKLLAGNPRYFKNAIRAALRDKAEVTPATFEVAGRSYSGWRVKVTPFAGDANAKRMRGLDTLTYEFDVAHDLPGEIARIAVSADVAAGRLWEEALTYDPKGT